MDNIFKFSEAQLDALFPFHILLNSDLKIVRAGRSFGKMGAIFESHLFEANFIIERPHIETYSFEKVKELCNQLVVIKLKSSFSIPLRGEFTYFEPSNQLLFIGSPWFATMEQVTDSNLTLHDFAYHDPLIDLLHVLKTQEIANQDLKELVKTINHQKKELSAATKEIHDIALFPMQNPDPLIRIDFDGKVLKMNPPAEILQSFILEGETLSQENFWKKIATMVDKHEGLQTIEAVSNERIYSFRIKVLAEDKYFNVYGRDVTEQKKNEIALKNKEEKYRNIISNINLGLIEVDNNDTIIYANQSFCKMSGYDVEELNGKNASQLFLSKDGQAIVASKNKKREEGHADAYEVEAINKKGEKKWWLISGAPTYNDAGIMQGSTGIHLDITAQKQMETELREAKNQAEASNMSKQIFLANMSHEIRTPMNAIIGMSNQLAKSELEEKQRFYLQTIQDSAEHLLVIINNILDLSKIEAGKISLEQIAFRPKELLGKVMQAFVLKAEEKGIFFTNSFCDINLAPVVISDPHRIQQILLNLVSNAIKFTNQGGVDISCTVVKDALYKQKVQIVVKDSGIGMDENYLKNLFDKFSQEYTSTTRKFGGTGLGMSITKDLVELLNGKIKVESKKNLGTTITIELDLIKGTESDLPKTELQTDDFSILIDKKVLVVDDNDLNRLVAHIILQNKEVKVLEASNGKEAVNILQNEDVDVILMDLQMPIMNGYEATKAIKEFKPNVPVIAVTANVVKDEADKCYAAGMVNYISKPFVENEFLSIISNSIMSQKEHKTTMYNLRMLQDISGGNHDFINQMIELFCDQTPKLVNEMQEAYHQKNYVRMGEIAHKIKPSIDQLEITGVKDKIRIVENCGKKNELDDDFDITFTFVADHLNLVVKELGDTIK